MDELLKSWRMPDDVVELFLKNGIEPNHLGSLSDDNLKELCPLMGMRIDLKKKIAEFLDSLNITETATTTSSDINDLEFPGQDINNLDISLSDVLIAPQFENFDLKTLLETSPCGKGILQFYLTNGCLDTKRRNRLTDIIIRHLFTFIVNKRLTYDDYTILSGKIITLFPQETASTYFTRPIKKNESNTGKSVAAKGKLIDRVRNLLFQSGERKRKSTSHNTEETSKRKIQIKTTNDTTKEENTYFCDWLKYNNEPWDEVIAKWRATAKFRHEKEYENVAQFIREWRILNNPKAVQLVTKLSTHLGY